MRNIAFVKDPDGYWIEIIRMTDEERQRRRRTHQPTGSNHAMLRVKSVDVNLKFYQVVLGMTAVRIVEQKAGDFNLYFHGYPASNPPLKDDTWNPVAEWEGLLELT